MLKRRFAERVPPPALVMFRHNKVRGWILEIRKLCLRCLILILVAACHLEAPALDHCFPKPPLPFLGPDVHLRWGAGAGCTDPLGTGGVRCSLGRSRSTAANAVWPDRKTADRSFQGEWVWAREALTGEGRLWQPNCRCRCINCLALLIHWAVSKHISLTMSIFTPLSGRVYLASAGSGLHRRGGGIHHRHPTPERRRPRAPPAPKTPLG